ncbi:MAG: FAD-dependent oxidoreductase, partial [Caulobacteraceae bacterium]
MRPGTVHVIGGGVAGLSAAVTLGAASARVIVYEGAAQAGGRCRSYFDPQLELMIDNGNHLVLSGNYAVEEYLETIGGEAGLTGPETACFPFVDVETKARWKVEPNTGPLPWWVLAKSRRVPGSKPRDYLK